MDWGNHVQGKQPLKDHLYACLSKIHLGILGEGKRDQFRPISCKKTLYTEGAAESEAGLCWSLG